MKEPLTAEWTSAEPPPPSPAEMVRLGKRLECHGLLAMLPDEGLPEALEELLAIYRYQTEGAR